MRRRSKIVRVTLVLAITLLGLVSLAQASFWVKGVGFYYSPDYGDLRKYLEMDDPYYDTPSRLGPGSGLGFSGGYDFSKSSGVRLDAFSFTGTADYRHLTLPDTFLFETSTSPIIFSVVYRLGSRGKLHPYLGLGVGSFPSKLTVHANIPGREYEGEDSPIGFQVLGGGEYRVATGFFLSGEIRYLSAKADYPEYRCLPSCSTDWSGVFIALGLGYNL